ncbi:MAG: autotransporter outer membrane beta-barrel domain-containing protein, partial [Alphaproteobacteria bacterium]|nr:autotransporter outer membrane beta-barrel domain-containing protein [Alphaproteobacteria bacterium]
WYTDLVVQANKFDSINATPVVGLGFGTDGWGLTASAEAGYTIQLGQGYSIIPQAQLIYQRTSINGLTNASGQLNYGATDEIYGRLGGRLAKNWMTNDNRVVTTWFDANFWHQFGDNPTTSYISATNPALNQSISSNLGGTWAQLGLGISGRMNQNLSAFGSVDYNIGLDRPEHAVGGRAGVKVVW